MSISFSNKIGNLYLACLVVQIISQYNFSNTYINHNSIILNSIDKVINILLPNQSINSYMNDSYISNTTLDICFPNDLDQSQYSDQIYQLIEYVGIYIICVISLEFMLIQNKLQGLFICFWCLFIHYSIIWKNLLEISNIPTYHEYIWLGFATISFTTLSNSLKNTKRKREKIVSILEPLQLTKLQIYVLYNHILMIGLISLILLGMLSNQTILLITLCIYILNIGLDPHYFIGFFEICSVFEMYIDRSQYYHLLGLITCYLIFVRNNVFNLVVKQNMITLISIKIVGIFFHSIYGNFLCK